MFKNKKIILLFLLSTFYFLLSNSTQAARLSFSVPDEIRAGNMFSVQVLINPEEFINAIEGKIKFNPDLLEFKDFSDGSSIINLWVEKPALVGKDTIGFSGIIPGGVGSVISNESNVISLSFLAKKPGLSRLTLENFKVYLHQAGAREAFSVAEAMTIHILEADKKAEDKTLILDFYPPEKFPIFVAKVPDLFDGTRVVIFSAQDKGSGIDHYEIKEKTLGLFGEWRKADSPYVLQHWYPFSIIEVRAVDKVGLERIERFIPRGFIYMIIGCLVMLLALIFTFLAWFTKRTFKQYIDLRCR